MISTIAMNDRLPLFALLSQVLVAFTMEFDNEFEHSVPHRTTRHGSIGGSPSVPWLVSMVMWLQFMRFVPDQGIPAEDLYRLTGLSAKAFRMWLVRMSKWWGYVTVSRSFVRPSPGGLKALETWRPLTGVIEKRWQERFSSSLDELREVIECMADKLGPGYPGYLPVLGYELLSKAPVQNSRAPRGARSIARSDDTLPMLLAKLLLAFAVEFERESGLSLAVSANVLRLTPDEGVRVRDLSRLSGVSKEAVALALRRAEECGLGVVQRQSPSNRVKVFVLTSEGRRGRNRYLQLVWKIEKDWKAKFGRENVEKLRELLERMAGTSAAKSSPLLKGLDPYPEGWRASVARLEQLPHYPMVLHRGGFPDGS
jgi:DNA-binding MarR family transcriptional regulator